MLDLYKNIKKRRQELNMSQQELAEAVGYKGKSMISQVEKGNVDLPESMIIKFADALQTTPSYLMGWSKIPQTVTGHQLEVVEVKTINNVIPNVERDHLFELYQEAPPEIQAAIDTLLGYKKPDA